jgi:hypothetical protein
MSASLALLHGAAASPLDRIAAFQALRKMVLNSVASEHSKRNYAKALDEVFALCEERKQPLSRALLMEYRAAMLEKKLNASTVNVRLFAVRKLIGEAQRNGIIGAEEAANPCWRSQPLPKGNQAGELAHAGAGQGAPHGPGPLQDQRKAGLRDFGVAAGLRPAPAGAGQSGR